MKRFLEHATVFLRAHLALVLLACLTVLVVLWQWNATGATRWERDRAREVAALEADAQERARLLVQVAGVRDSLAQLRREQAALTETARGHAARAEALRRRLDHALDAVPDTAALVPRTLLDDARSEAEAWRRAYVTADSARRLEAERSLLLSQSLEAVSAQLAREQDRAPEVLRVLTRAEPPCRLLFFACPSRATTLVVGLAAGAVVTASLTR